MSYIPIIAVDFDGTLCEDKWPRIGEPKLDVINKLLDLRQKLGVKIILWTCRTDEDLVAAVDFCNYYGLRFDAVNDHLDAMKEKFGNNPRKVCASVYLDDKNATINDVNKLEEIILNEIERHI